MQVTSQVSDPDLGARMLAAVSSALDNGSSKVIIFGTDVPGLKQEAFEAAVCLLDSHDLVFGPARDGGYYMVGMKHPHAAIFQNVDWSTPAVLSASVAIAQHHRLAVPVPLGLPQLIDIDVVKDLKGWVQECSEAEMATPIWTAAHQDFRIASASDWRL